VKKGRVEYQEAKRAPRSYTSEVDQGTTDGSVLDSAVLKYRQRSVPLTFPE
jgi:hypothetical protein